MSIVFGVDAGGTKTLAAGVDRSARVVSFFALAGLDPTSVPDAQAQLMAFADAVVGPDVIAAATLGLPYHDEIPNISRLQIQVAQSRFGQGARVLNDVAVAHIGAFANNDGILSLAGTGAMAWAKGPAGSARASGFGDVIGDEGSAFWIGRRALALLAREQDGRLLASAFGSALSRSMDAGDQGLIDWVHSAANTRAAVASIARHVSAIAEAGDETARAILKKAGNELALAAKAAAKAAGLPKDAKWACAGGVYADPVVRETVSDALGGGPVASVLLPVGGAVLDAALRAGWNVDDAWIARVNAGLSAACTPNDKQETVKESL